MLTVEVHRLAAKEARRARQYIGRHRPAAAHRFGMAFQDALTRIGAMQTAHAPHLYGTRTCHVKRFSYYLVFLVHATRVYVLAVSHDRRQQGYWRRRLYTP